MNVQGMSEAFNDSSNRTFMELKYFIFQFVDASTVF